MRTRTACPPSHAHRGTREGTIGGWRDGGQAAGPR